MVKSNSNGVDVPGTPTPVEFSGPVNAPDALKVDLDNIEKWLTDDLNRCVTLLNAILTDKELRMQMAVWFEGRIANAKHKADAGEINKPK